MNFTKADLQPYLQYKASRSGGKGGQNVNKVSTKVELLFPIQSATFFTDDEKQLLLSKLGSRLNKDGYLQVVCDEERSQYLNKEIALERLHHLLVQALHRPKKRKASKPTKASIAARLDTKRKAALKKMNRRVNGGFD